MECIRCGDRLNENGVCENCGYTLGEEVTIAPTAAEDGGEISFTPASTKICPSCQAECAEGSKFCQDCGYSFTGAANAQPSNTALGNNPYTAQSVVGQTMPQRRCNYCGQSIEQSSIYCGHCGRNANAEVTSAPPRPVYNDYQHTQSTLNPTLGVKRRNSFAKAAFWLSLFGWCYFMWIPGMILAKNALRFARENGGVGRGLAITAHVFATIWATLYGFGFFTLCAQLL